MTSPTPDNTAAQSAADKRKNLETIYPLAPLQEGILFHCLTAPDSGTYMPQISFHLEGQIDATALKSCWQQILSRHQSLRAGVHWEERDEPFQVIYRQVPLHWEELDWSAYDASGQTDQLQALYDRNRAEPFDLRRPPLLRLYWAKLGDNQHVLILCYHHIILDGWSTSQMLGEVFALYHQTTGAAVPPLPPARAYGDYIKWLKTRDQEASGQYWREYTEKSPGQSRMFGDSEAAHDFVRQEWAFPAALVEQLNGFTGRQGLTLSTVLHGVLGLQVAQQLGRDDVFFGSATAGRPASLPGATSMVGLFINALPVRVRFDPAQPLADWLAALQHQQAATMEHEYIALRHIQKDMGTLFDCLLVIENYPTSIGQAPQSDIRLTRVEFDEWTHFPLTLLVATSESQLKLILRYDQSVLSPAKLEAFVATFADLLARMVSAPLIPIRELIGDVVTVQAAPVQTAMKAGYIAPSTDTEQQLATIWGEVLKQQNIGAQDNFFEAGGHSLLAVKVANRIRSGFELDIAIRAMFERPVLRDLATYIDALQAAAPPADAANPAAVVMEF